MHITNLSYDLYIHVPTALAVGLIVGFFIGGILGSELPMLFTGNNRESTMNSLRKLTASRMKKSASIDWIGALIYQTQRNSHSYINTSVTFDRSIILLL